MEEFAKLNDAIGNVKDEIVGEIAETTAFIVNDIEDELKDIAWQITCNSDGNANDVIKFSFDKTAQKVAKALKELNTAAACKDVSKITGNHSCHSMYVLDQIDLKTRKTFNF